MTNDIDRAKYCTSRCFNDIECPHEHKEETINTTSNKIEIRDDCKICGGTLPNARYRTYCSKKCRTKRNNAQQKEYFNIWQRKKRAETHAITAEIQ